MTFLPLRLLGLILPLLALPLNTGRPEIDLYPKTTLACILPELCHTHEYPTECFVEATTYHPNITIF